MIIIRQNKLNQVVTTLKEMQCVPSTIYLLQFINKSTNDFFYVIATDISTSPDRYQLFCITEIGSGTPDPTQGEVLLTLQGQYDYNIFANPDSLLDPTGLNQVETGKLLVTGFSPQLPVYQSNVNPDLVMYKNTDLNA
jgi:hypothetical protein